MKVPLGNLAQFGVNKDTTDYTLPETIWTDARNVRLQDGKLVRMTGHQETLVGFPQTAYWARHVLDASGNSHWIIADIDKVYDFSSDTWTEITKLATSYGATINHLWNGGQIGNVPVINNGVDVPQMWAPVNSATKLVDLTNWPSTLRAQIVRPFKYWLFALDLTDASSRFGHRVRISHPAVPGAVPSSWDPTDATKDVYENEVGGVDDGFLVDCAPMRDFNILYKDHSTHGAQFIGGRDKWRIFPIFDQIGLFQPDCVTPFSNNSMHFVMTGEDIIIHNGQTPQSILTARLRRWLVANMDIVNYPRSFTVHNHSEKEVIACIPLSGSEFPNLGLVWNYAQNTLTFRELDQFSFIADGRIPSADTGDWDSDDESWDADTTSWDTFTHPPFVRRLLAVKPSTNKLFHMDFTDGFDGANFTASIERFGFDLIGVSRTGEPLHNREMMRLVKRAYIQAKGAPFNVQLATQQEIEGAISWSTPELFTPGVDKFVDFEDAKATQLFGLRISSTAQSNWEVSGIELDIEALGEF